MFIRPIHMPNNDVAAYLDASDLEIPNYEELKPLLVFKIQTYIKLRKIRHSYDEEHEVYTGDIWNIAFASINQFLNEMPKEHQAKMVVCMASMHQKIRDFFLNDVPIIELNLMLKSVAAILDEFDQDVDFCGQISNYINTHMVVGLMENAGKRAQDSEEMTFYPEHVHQLMTITLLCKILTPVYSVLMDYLSVRIDKNLKEMHCAVVLSKLLDRRYADVINKLQYYIRKTINRLIEENASTLMHGYSLETLAYSMYVSLLARKFVNVDLRDNNGKNNLITFILVSIKKSVRAIVSLTKKNPTYDRKPIAQKHEDDGNTAQIEIDSLTSRKTIDVTPIVSMSVDSIIQRYMRQYQISDDEFAQVMEYYEKNPIRPNPINKNMNAMFYGRDIGGAFGLLLIHSREYTKLTALLQMILFSLDANYCELGHMLTAHMADIAADLGTSSSTFKISVTNSPAFKRVRDLFELNRYGIRGKDWEIHISKLCEKMMTSKFVYNTASYLWDFLKEDNRNNQILIPEPVAIVAMCDVYSFITHPEEG